jgi:hypothetical protein
MSPLEGVYIVTKPSNLFDGSTELITSIEFPII